MCDEATDVKNVSELVVCLRLVDDELEAHDEFIDSENMPNTDADSIMQEFKNVLLQMRLKFSYYFGIHLAQFILSHSNNLSQTLQGIQMTEVDAHVVSVLLLLLSNEFILTMNLIWNKVKQFAEKHKSDKLHLICCVEKTSLIVI